MRRPRFTVRSLMIAVAVVASLFGVTRLYPVLALPLALSVIGAFLLVIMAYLLVRIAALAAFVRRAIRVRE